MKLIIAEKPELGRAIAQALNLNNPDRNGEFRIEITPLFGLMDIL
jgi:hypothetical protein